jgi:hypothetical protein
MKRIITAFALIGLLLWTLILHQYHMGVLAPPIVPAGEAGEGIWIARETAGLNHLIVKGTPYTRGLKAGELTRDLLLRQEQALVSQLQAWIPSPTILRLGTLGAIGYFYGADKFISSDDLLEMYGTSKSAAKDYDFLADGFTRQLAYHGLHEVGQMMVDRGVDMGCTVAAVPHGHSWILGRTFDFEGGRVFDSEKIVKWVFPDKGLAHVSVIWAGMVGAVTGVNERGLYVSINAAGSEGFRRVGTPSTLVLYKVLKEATNTEEALKIVRAAHMFITDIFVVLDASGRLVRVEKSPQKMDVVEATPPFAVANHLIGPTFANDKTNSFRYKELTSVARDNRARELVAKIPTTASAQEKIHKMLELLRDKGVDENGQTLHLHNRRAIDALIATHATIYDSVHNYLYVSQGPSVAGPMLGYDLTRSFEQQKPVLIDKLERDPLVSDQLYEEIKTSAHEIKSAGSMVRRGNCEQAKAKLDSLGSAARLQGDYYHVLGDTFDCLKQRTEARAAWSKALELKPAYASAQRDLAKKLEQQ